MRVEVMRATSKPIEVISLAAGGCYAKTDASEKRVRNIFKVKHMSIFEHAYLTFKVEGISRACLAQLTRHRHMSFCVESQRYCKYDEEFFEGDWYVMPEKFGDWKVSNPLTEKEYRAFDSFMKDRAREYLFAVDRGIKPEDARYLLPEATKTNLTMTLNVRELFHFLDMRWDKHAQWEIRDLAKAMFEAAKAAGPQWAELMGLYEEGRESEC